MSDFNANLAALLAILERDHLVVTDIENDAAWPVNAHVIDTIAQAQSLTRELEEAKTLVALALDRLEDVDDVGPRDEGWQSAELMEWIAKARDLSRAQPGQDDAP